MEYLRKVVRTNKEPDEKEVLWVDTAHPDYPVMKYYENGNWKLIRQREDGVAYIMPYGGIPYSDLSQEVKMAIASGGAQSDWNQASTSSPDYIWNKPYIPRALADLTEDSNHKFVSATEKTNWSNKADKVQSAVAGHIATLNSSGNLVDSGKGISDINPLWGNIQGSIENQTDLMSALGDKYEKPSTGIPASDLAEGVIPEDYVIYEELSGGEDIPVEPISGGGGELSDEVKQAILDAFEQVAWVTNQGQTYYNALADLFFPTKTLTSITAVYTQPGTVYDDASLDSLKANLVVTAHYDDNTSAVVTNYTLSGTLSVGTSTVTVTYQSKTTTFSVTVTARPTVANITATYTQSGTVYTTDSLDSLKSDLVVKAVYTDTTEDTLNASDYTLSGTLTAGTSTITVTFQTFTTTFTVTVTEMQVYSITNSLTGCSSSNNATSANDGSSYSATITESTGYTLTGATVSVTMGGTDITSTAYNNGTISIASVTENVVITIVAEVVSGTWVDLNTSMFTATRSDVTINAAGFIHQENIVVTTPETKYPEIMLDSRITGLDFDIDNTGAYTWLILAGTKDNYGAIALTQASGGYPAEMLDGQTGKTSGLGGTKLNGCPYGNGHYTVTRDSSGITISKTGGASVTYTTANQPLYDYGTSASWIFGFCIQPNSPTGNGYKNVKVKFGGNE